ncbi:MAG: acyl-CoA synthetase [Pseudomonadota bacterium]
MTKPSYADAISTFDWSQALDDLGWNGLTDVDLAWTLVDRHVSAGLGHRTAILWVGADGTERRVSFSELSNESKRVANLLQRHGLKIGDRVAGILPRAPETVSIIVGCLRAGAIYVPIFSGFAAEAVSYRLEHSSARFAFVGSKYRHLVGPNNSIKVIALGAGEAGDIDYTGSTASEADTFVSVKTSRSAPAFIIYTSGSTGKPKGCVIAANLPAAMWPYVRFSLDLQPATDVFWPTGDPSWGYGLCCYLPALAAGASIISVEPNASAEVCLDIISKYGVTNFATNPTVLRSLMARGDSIAQAGTSVRAISCCGEPLNGEVVTFFQRVWGCTPMDHFGATEFGLPVGNHNSLLMAVKPGSMGLPSPGQTMAIVNEEGAELPSGTTGFIAQRTNANSQYWLQYWNDRDATNALSKGEWKCTGDFARRDDDGYYWFEGRSDDIIKSSGYRIGPFEIESALLRHPDVVEAAVVGTPDELRGEAIKAFVVLRVPPHDAEALSSELVQLAKSVCGRHQYPHLIEFVANLPKTQTGKIQRFLLRSSGSTGH